MFAKSAVVAKMAFFSFEVRCSWLCSHQQAGLKKTAVLWFGNSAFLEVKSVESGPFTMFIACQKRL